MPIIKPIKSEHKKILDRIRELYIESGGRPFDEPEAWGLNKFEKSNNGIQVHFDYGSPDRMYTPDGGYMILGGHIQGDHEKFWESFFREFEVVTVVEKRNDGNVSELEYLSQYSGPIVRITQRI